VPVKAASAAGDDRVSELLTVHGAAYVLESPDARREVFGDRAAGAQHAAQHVAIDLATSRHDEGAGGWTVIGDGDAAAQGVEQFELHAGQVPSAALNLSIDRSPSFSSMLYAVFEVTVTTAALAPRAKSVPLRQTGFSSSFS
jgi:hypothetical protein